MAGLYEDIAAARAQQNQRAAERFADSEPARSKNERARERNGTAVHDTLERLQARADRLLAGSEAPADAIVKVAVSPTDNRKLALERIIDATNELQSWTFLPRGTRAARTVARITLLDRGRELPLGTGFLVSPRLLMTNNHVLPTSQAAQRVIVEFCAELDVDNQPQNSSRFELDPSAFFVTDDHLDMTLVLVRPGTDGMPAGEHFGWNQLIPEQGKIVVGEPVNIIGHPRGRLKEIAVRHNNLLLLLADFLQYSTDTEPGNSGSPVFNDQWEVVGLHHAGVPKKDDQGRLLRKDGKLWQDGDGDDAISWIANEGARTSRILAFLSAQALDPARSALLAEMGAPAPGRTVSATILAGAVGEPDDAERVAPVTMAAPSGGRSTAGVRGERINGINLVFLHGRGQQGRDPSRLRVEWMAGLNAGLTRAERPPLDPATAWFPFYGDRLAGSLIPRQAPAPATEALVNPAESFAPPPDDPARPIYEQLLSQAAVRAGLPPESSPDGGTADEGLRAIGAGLVGKLQRQLSWLSRRTGLDDTVIALVFADVAEYLGRPKVRESVLEEVAAQWPAGPLVLVSHSLGTVVAMDMLTTLGQEAEASLLVTAGSPLGMDAVHDRLLAGGVHQPQQVRQWVNAWSPTDAVAIGCPLGPIWGPHVTDLVTDNPEDRAHSIAEYLGDARVARYIGDALAKAAAPLGG